MPLRLATLLLPMSGPSVSPLRQAPLRLTPSYCPSGQPLCLTGRLASPSRPSISPPPSSPSFPPVVLPLRLAPGLAPPSRPSISPLRLSLRSLPSVPFALSLTPMSSPCVSLRLALCLALGLAPPSRLSALALRPSPRSAPPSFPYISPVSLNTILTS